MFIQHTYKETQLIDHHSESQIITITRTKVSRNVNSKDNDAKTLLTKTPYKTPLFTN